MNKKSILTLDQLVNFVEQNKMYNFSSQETGHRIFVRVPDIVEFEEKDDEKDYMHEGLEFYPARICHTLLNRNNSYISEKNMRKALPSLAYRPFLGAIHQLDDGTYDFHTHDMELVENEDGEYEFEYIETQLGAFTVDKPKLVYDETNDKTYVEAVVAIPTEYSKAAEIIKRKGGTKVSCELAIDKMSYDVENKWLVLEDFIFSGVTALGSEKDGTEILEGMEGSRLNIDEFSASTMNYDRDKELIETLEKLNETLSNFHIDKNTQKGGLRMNKIQELLEKYGKSLNDITFDYEGLTDEELEAKFAEQFFDGDDPGTGGETGGQETGGQETGGQETGGQDPVVEEPEVPEPTEEDQTAATAVATSIGALTDDSTELEVAAVRDAYDALTDIQKGLVSAEVLAVLTAQETRITEEKNLKIDDSETPESKKIADEFQVSPESYAVVMTDGTVKEFAVSLQDQISALTMLVNETYGETDGCWYDVIVYDKDVVMSDWWTGRAFRQSYKVRSGVYSLVGDRVQVHSVFVTDDEEKALDELKANFASASAELDKYRAAEEKAKKQDLMSSDDYRSIFDKDEFKDIDIDKFSLDELTAHLDEVLLKYAKEGNLNFSSTPAENKPNEHKKLFGQPSKRTKKGRYGSIFKKN